MTKEDTNRIFSENLKRLLKSRDMQQLELARRLGTGAATVNDWVKGRSTPRTPALQKIAAVFGCEMSDLLTEGASCAPQAETELKAAFFGGYADDLSEQEIDELWNDAKDYFTYRIGQMKKRRE